ncbi:hypothetical protein SteCoe_13590 [Stentor coeruleus]|uniref:Enkurin domain-containing protein n=1 Tax=Stentor coeruleus TaxID=5963 RepID=A0A1R2C854_9CILI|nr:hypothetical protein SteCoe_13590 [Stentor coeruleus]
MSKEQELDMKSQLSKHINSKLFKRYLDKEASRVGEISPSGRMSYQYSERMSPSRGRRENTYSSDDEQPSLNRTSLSRSISYRDRYLRSRESSPLLYRHKSPEKNIFASPESRFGSRIIDEDLPRKELFTRNTRDNINSRGYFQTYSPDNVILRQYEDKESKLKDEMILIKEKYERILANKNQEIKRLQKNIDNMKIHTSTLQQKLEGLEENDRKFFKTKEKMIVIENELARVKDKNKRLESENQELRDKNTRETAQQIRETEFLRRKIEDLTNEISNKSLNFSRSENRLERYEKPRNDSTYNHPYGEPKRENSDNYDGRRRVYNGYEQRPDPITWQTRDSTTYYKPPYENHNSLETKLMSLHMDKKRLEDEAAKIPPHGRRVAQIKRQQEIELELEIINSSISTIRNKLRQSSII